MVETVIMGNKSGTKNTTQNRGPNFDEQIGAAKLRVNLPNYAPINVKPHYPPPGLTRRLVGDFDPI